MDSLINQLIIFATRSIDFFYMLMSELFHAKTSHKHDKVIFDNV